MNTNISTGAVLECALDDLAGGRQQLSDDFGKIIAKAFNYVLDGEDSIDDLEAVVKTFIGTKIEKVFLKHFDLPSNTTASKNARKACGEKCLDLNLAGIDLDIKFTSRTKSPNWMIPPEAVGEWCLLIKADFEASLFSYGLFEARDEWLTSAKGANRDEKRSISAFGKEHIRWMGQGLTIPDDQAFHVWSLEGDFSRIASSLSGLLASSPRKTFDDLSQVPNSAGVYTIWRESDLVYVGKAVAAGGLRSRLGQHRTKISEARSLDLSEMSHQFLICDPNLATGLEGYLIGQHQAPWNGTGFGSKVAGKGRPNQKTALWDIEYGRAPSRSQP